MPKITVHGGPSTWTPGPLATVIEEAVDLTEDVVDLVTGHGDEIELPDPYVGWTVKDLRAELANRNLPTGGSKMQLRIRLIADDEPEPVATQPETE